MKNVAIIIGSVCGLFVSFKLGVHVGYFRSAIILKEEANRRRQRYGKYIGEK